MTKADLAIDSYTAHVETHPMTGDTMSDAGVPVGQLEPIGSCTLTPGDPSPCGRTEDGDLAYPVLRKHGSLQCTRRNLARIAHLLAVDLSITTKPKPPYDESAYLFILALNEALPRVLFSSSHHGDLAYKKGVEDIIAGRLDQLPAWLDADE